MKNLVYIATGRSSVFDSQVLALLKYYVEQNLFKEVLLLFGYRNQADIDWVVNKQTKGINLILYKTYPNYPFYNWKIRNNISNALSKRKIDYQNTVFHIRGEMTSYHFKKIIHKHKIDISRVLTDVRGVSYEEVNEFMEINPLLKKLKLKNIRASLRALKKDDKISVVSSELKNYLVNNWKIPQKKIEINSCLVPSVFNFNKKIRIEIRERLNLNDEDLLIIFTSGGSAKWQENHMITDIANKGFKVLNLSKVPIKHENIINLFVPYNEVPAYLCAADAAFIWRAKSMVNKVASPVKFSEYMACGLPIIHNGSVSLINTVCDQMTNGLLIHSVSDLNQAEIQKLVLNSNRNEVSTGGHKLFGLSQISESYRLIYKDYN